MEVRRSGLASRCGDWDPRPQILSIELAVQVVRVLIAFVDKGAKRRRPLRPTITMTMAMAAFNPSPIISKPFPNFHHRLSFTSPRTIKLSCSSPRYRAHGEHQHPPVIHHPLSSISSWLGESAATAGVLVLVGTSLFFADPALAFKVSPLTSTFPIPIPVPVQIVIFEFFNLIILMKCELFFFLNVKLNLFCFNNTLNR